ncbi:MAG TPA: hypothetical protein DDX68_18875, partial [Clostridium sp.]|nr:hypothetical protein [Clostridium sp.]
MMLPRLSLSNISKAKVRRVNKAYKFRLYPNAEQMDLL